MNSAFGGVARVNRSVSFSETLPTQVTEFIGRGLTRCREIGFYIILTLVESNEISRAQIDLKINLKYRIQEKLSYINCA